MDVPMLRMRTGCGYGKFEIETSWTILSFCLGMHYGFDFLRFSVLQTCQGGKE